MCHSTTTAETPRTCAFCNAPITDACPDAQAIGICQPCYDCDGVPPTRYDASERHMSPAWQEEQYSARYEDRYGPGYDPYED